jgi:WD40 repeat protein
MTRGAQAFFQASDRAHRREKQLKRLGIVGLVTGLVLTTGLSGFAGYKVHQAERRRMRLYEEIAKSLSETDQLSSLYHGLAAINLSRSNFVRFPDLNGNSLIQPSLLDEPNRKMQFSYVMKHFGANAVAISANGKIIVSAGGDRRIRFWSDQGRPIYESLKTDSEEVPITISADGGAIAWGESDGNVWLWNGQRALLTNAEEKHVDGVTSVAMSPDGQTIVSGSRDGSLKIWSHQGILLDNSLEKQLGGITSIDISANGNIIISGDNSGNLKIWNRQKETISKVSTEYRIGLVAVAISADGQAIASGGFGVNHRFGHSD